jgi:hypothetical protein
MSTSDISDHPALAPSSAAVAAELQAPPPPSDPTFLLSALGVSGPSPLAALAPSGAAAAELQSAFLEPERGDGGQRWVDLNVASAEDIWGLFLSPSLMGVKLLLLFFFICCTASM